MDGTTGIMTTGIIKVTTIMTITGEVSAGVTGLATAVRTGEEAVSQTETAVADITETERKSTVRAAHARL